MRRVVVAVIALGLLATGGGFAAARAGATAPEPPEIGPAIVVQRAAPQPTTVPPTPTPSPECSSGEDEYPTTVPPAPPVPVDDDDDD